VRDDCPRTASPADCLDDNLVAGFVEGALDAAERSRVERLIDQCAVCRRHVSDVMRVRSTVGATPGVAATPTWPERVGRYEVRGKLGEGGMGVVLRAWDPQLEREVAVKLVRGESADGALRLVREARAMAKLRHPSVITVHDAGILGGEVFVVMELVDGENLAEYLARKPPWREALARCLAAGAGLAAAHARGLVHRDFKPHNVLCDRDGRILVADFGLARASPGVGDAASALTTTGAVVGTPAYMAPEQHLGEAVGPAADQFAFAATVYEALYAQRPFPGTTLAALISEVLSGKVRPPPPASDVPRELAAVVMRGLAREPAERWPSLQAMLDALVAPASATPPPPAASRRTLWIGLGAGAAAAAVIGVFAATRDPEPAPEAASEAAPEAASEPAAAPAPVSASEYARWDVLGELAGMEARARAWAPDARLFRIAAGKAVDPDGVIDASKRGSISYNFTSEKKASCWLELLVRDGRFHEIELTPATCADKPPVPPPRCSIAEIWKRFIVDGAEAARGAGVDYSVDDGAVRWLLWQGNLQRSYPDDC
jgi:hypothetical protein